VAGTDPWSRAEGAGQDARHAPVTRVAEALASGVVSTADVVVDGHVDRFRTMRARHRSQARNDDRADLHVSGARPSDERAASGVDRGDLRVCAVGPRTPLSSRGIQSVTRRSLLAFWISSKGSEHAAPHVIEIDSGRLPLGPDLVFDGSVASAAWLPDSSRLFCNPSVGDPRRR
jgi:hypothetical protein